MKETIIGLFGEFAGIIIFFHVISGVIWVGGMVAIRFAVHGAVQGIEDPQIRLGVVLKYLDAFLKVVRPLIGLLLVTAVFMTIGFGFKGTDLSPVAHTKEALWTIMTILFVMINLKKNTAQKFFDNKDYENAKNTLAPLTMFIIPANIILGVIAIYLGITLRGF
jgi:uncharacterized membrane protein